MVRIAGAALAVGLVLGGSAWSSAEAATISFQGIIVSAKFQISLANYDPELVGKTFIETISDLGNNQYSVDVSVPSFTIYEPSCIPSTFCNGPYYTAAGGTFLGFGSQNSVGNILQGDVVGSYGGIASYSYNKSTESAQSNVDLHYFPVFIGDESGDLVLTLSTVPLPASLPMFGGALLALSALAYGRKVRADTQRSVGRPKRMSS